MAIDFPSSPSVNDTFTVGDTIYKWDGTVWTSTVSGAVEFLPLTGGTVTGAITASGGVTASELTVDTDTLYVDSTNDRVGINEANPATELDVKFASSSGLSTTLDTEYQIADFRVPVQTNDTVDANIRIGSRRTVEGGTTSAQAESYIRGSRGGIVFDRGSGGASPSASVELTYSTDSFVSSRETALRVNDDGTMTAFGSITNNDTRAQGENGYHLGVGSVHVLTRNGGNASAILDVYGANGQFRVMGDGDCQNTNNNYGAISDIKLKENIVDANSQWDDLKSIQFRKYNFKAETGLPTHTQLGVVAQEIEQVCPGLVEDSYEEDEGVGESTKTVSYSILLMKAAVALQEAQSRIEALEQRLDAAGL